MIPRYKRTLLRLHRDIQALSAAPDDLERCVRIQNSLITAISGVEFRLRRNRNNRNSIKRRFGPHNPRLSRSESKKLKEQLLRIDEHVQDYKRLLAIFRSLGDGIAFTYFDRWDIKPLAYRENPGFISGKKGARLERSIMRRCLKRGVPAVLNDITNCLRIGDVTLLRPDGRPGLIEAKSGGSGGARGERQAVFANVIASFLHEDQAEDLYGHRGLFVRMAVHAGVSDHIIALNELIGDARMRRAAVRQVEPGLSYVVAFEMDQGLLENVLAGSLGKPVIAFTPNDPELATAYYPLCLSIFDPEDWYEFLIGTYAIFTMIDSGLLAQRFAEEGWRATFDFSADRPIELRSLSGHEAEGATIGSHMVGRLTTEFVALDWFIRQSCHHLDVARDSGLVEMPARYSL